VIVSHRWSRALYRLLLRAYPREFRCHFRADLEADFAQLLAARGRYAAWRRVICDWMASVQSTRADARAKRRQRIAAAYRGERRVSSILFDFRHALRGLIKAPVFSVVIVATLALGIGANSAIFSLVNAVLLRPLGYVAPERLMMIHEIIPESKVARFGVSPADYIDIQQYQGSFTELGIYRTRRAELSGGAEAEQVITAQMSPSVFAVLGVRPAIGRVFIDQDEQGEAVAIISDGLWQRRFGGQQVIGSKIVLDRQPYTIVGVMPASFQFPRRGAQFNNMPADVWLPLVFTPFERNARGMFFNHSVVGRLRDGVSVEQASADAATLGARLRDNYPAVIRNSPFSLMVAATPYGNELSGQVKRPLLILLGAVALVLLVACANVANLMLSRSVAREREIGVRSALGAAGHRLVQLMVLEGIILAFVGGALGLAIGQWVLRLTPAVLAASLPGLMEVSLDGRVVLFTFALSLVTALIFSFAPVVAGMRRDVNDLLRENGRGTGGRRGHRLQSALVMSSVAFAFVLLVGAGLLIKSFATLVSHTTGLRADNVLTLRVTLPPAGYSQPQQIRNFYRDAGDRLRAMPGVRAVSVSTDLPIKDDGERRAFTPERAGEAGGLPPSIAVTWVNGDYFATFGIPIMKGRGFSAEDHAENRGAVIVSAALAERFWPGADPLGKRIKWGIAASTAPWQTIVGVAGDVVDGPLGTEPPLHAYVPYSEVPDAALAGPIAGLLRGMSIAVRADIDATSLAASARQAISSLDRALAVSDVSTMDQVLRDASAPQRFSASVLGAFAGGALLLAAIGLYGVLAFSVGQRTREIGVRLALGADPSGVVRLVLRQGMTLAATGLVLGAVGAVAAGRLMSSLLFETTPYDAMTYAVVPLLLAMVSLVACYIPARRAAAVAPLDALRAD
jgi:putative ABC transport system permease protein